MPFITDPNYYIKAYSLISRCWRTFVTLPASISTLISSSLPGVRMIDSIMIVFRCFTSLLKTRMGLQAENLALRHQLCVLQRSVKRPKIRPADRILWSLLSRVWADWKDALIFVKPDTVIRWQQKRFKEHWTKLSQMGEPGRPPIPLEIRDLIQTLSRTNPTWGSPHIVGELAKPELSWRNLPSRSTRPEPRSRRAKHGAAF